MPLEFLISALVTLLVVVDPVGLVPTFLAITARPAAHGARAAVALRACLIAAAILAGSALIGDWLLRTLGDHAARIPHRRRPAAVFGRLRNGVRRAHRSGSRSRPSRRSRSTSATSPPFRSPSR